MHEKCWGIQFSYLWYLQYFGLFTVSESMPTKAVICHSLYDGYDLKIGIDIFCVCHKSTFRMNTMTCDRFVELNLALIDSMAVSLFC